MMLRNIVLAIVLTVSFSVTVSANTTVNPRGVCDLLDRIGGEGTATRVITVLDDTYGSADNEKFMICALNGKPCIKGTTLSALTMGVGWYLNHYAKVNLSWNRLSDDLSDVNFPIPQYEEEHSTRARYRHYLNYCTFAYSASTWTKERWMQEIDWMALHGINMPLQIIGLETVWRNMLIQDYGYTEKEADDFIAGPCFMAWFAMNNLEGHGGPNPKWWYERQANLCHLISDRMYELGMTPVLPGFSGMVPSNFSAKTGIASNDQGLWVNGFKRPHTLTPASAEFDKVAADYYNRLTEVMGPSEYYSMDPFHEAGGSTGGVDARQAYSSIYASLDKARPGAKWLIQQWQWNGGQWQSVADNVIPKGKLIVLDLYSDGQGGSMLERYNGHETVYCMIPNFGGRTGLFGRLTTLVDSYFDRAVPNQDVIGLAALPEGIGQVPVTYDLFYDLAWMESKPDIAEWLSDYSTRRYGVENHSASEAWQLLGASSLNCNTNLQGPHEAVTCARPDTIVDAVSAWGGSDIFYEANDVATAAYKLLDANLKGNNYNYDLIDISRQALTDYSKLLLDAVNEAYKSNDTVLFTVRRDNFLQLILDLDQLLNSHPEFMLGHWTEQARKIADEFPGTTDEDRDWLELNNARTLITTWAPTPGALHDYSYREWGGIMKDLYYERWKKWFDNEMQEIPTGWFDFERSWALDKSRRYPVEPIGDTRQIISELLPRYISPLVSSIPDQKVQYIPRLTEIILKDKFYDSATRGGVYSPTIDCNGTQISEIAIDFNGNELFDVDEVKCGPSYAIEVDAPTGNRTIRLKLADSTTVTYTLCVGDNTAKLKTIVSDNVYLSKR